MSRRGVSGAGALVVATLATQSAKAAVPGSLTNATIRAVTGGAASGTAAGLAAGYLQAVVATKAISLAAVLTIAAGALLAVSGTKIGKAEPPAARVPPPVSAARHLARAEARSSAIPAVPKPDESIEITGRVIRPDGRPAAVAAVRIVLWPRTVGTAPETTSGPDGKFRIRLPNTLRDAVWRYETDRRPNIVATASGFGIGTGFFAAEEPGEVTVRLVEPGPALEGRILDLEGRPVPRARVWSDFLSMPEGDGELGPWIDGLNDGTGRATRTGLVTFPATFSASTGPDGRFRLEGIGRERLVDLHVAGPGIATDRFRAMTRTGEEVSYVQKDFLGSKAVVVHSSLFDFAAAPSKPIEGVVRDTDTGRPIAGVEVKGAIFEARSYIPAADIRTATDANGQYRLDGLPKGPAYRLFLKPGPGVPYPAATVKVNASTPGLQAVPGDLALKLGILLRGRVIDKVTGAPIPISYVTACTFADNPLLSEYSGYEHSNPHQSAHEKGQYEVVVVPGRGLIAARVEGGRHRGVTGYEGIEGYDPKRQDFPTSVPQCHIMSNYHAMGEYRLDAGTDSATLDLQADPGRSLRITVVDPQGKPIGDTVAHGIQDLFLSTAYPQKSAEIEIWSLGKGRPRRVTVTHEGRRLVGSVVLKGDETGPIRLPLQPWGEITGRMVDDDGHPRKGLGVSNGSGSKARTFDNSGSLPGADRGGGVACDKDGRFRFVGIVPGLYYSAYADELDSIVGRLFRDVMVAPGEVKDLGDLKVLPHNSEE